MLYHAARAVSTYMYGSQELAAPLARWPIAVFVGRLAMRCDARRARRAVALGVAERPRGPRLILNRRRNLAGTAKTFAPHPTVFYDDSRRYTAIAHTTDRHSA